MDSKDNFNRIEEAIEDIKKGKMVIVVDDPERENEGDLIISAEKITPADVNFITREARGILCVAIDEEKAKKLNLELMVTDNTALNQTSFTVTIDYKIGTTTGVSAYDRAKTINAVANQDSRAEDFARPGHIFPLIAKNGGVLKRAGHTEAAVDLMKLANLSPVGALCEIMAEDGTMARIPQLLNFAKKYNLKIITIADLIEFRRRKEKLVKELTVVNFPSKYGNFKLHLFQNLIDPNDTPVAIVKGKLDEEPTLVRVHSECLTGDVFGSKRCDCGDQLTKALEMIEKEGKGVVLYMRQEGRGIGLVNKIFAYDLQDKGKDTVEANELLGFKADLRNYGIGAQVLKELGLKKLRLMTNNPMKIIGLKGYDLQIVERVPIEIHPNEVNEKYLRTKSEKLGHLILKKDS
ncbi:bifunctional 3,4-dihydroxy-2-butanone-4-phosphate synthase/GTP cyclohydrolase II [Melioribacteraceae bacterium 4301-Me]|uniref:bifunctional 3,4-dihydroxy-2-butanone-4-phosphate synthase/GTP cyclohydrolase II n=1 Tax=Pyranulibacter aquaticus TaxID=3163344 RepID=UPI0035972648